MRRGRFNSTVFVIAVAASFAFHAVVVVPRIVATLSQTGEAPVEVEYIAEVPSAESPAEQPAAEESKDEPKPEPEPEKLAEKTEPPEPEKVKLRKPEEPKPQPPPPEVATVEPPKPEPPKPPPPPPPPPMELPKQRMHMVDQDRYQDEEDNQDAKYLAQKNHRVAEETLGKDRNLVLDSQAPKDTPRPSSESDNKLPEAGDKDQKIAELEDRKGDPHELIHGRPMPGKDGELPKNSPRGPLAMRDLTPKAQNQPKPEKARDGLEEQELGDGPLPQRRAGDADKRATADKRGTQGKPNLTLPPLAYDKIVGFDTAESERRVAARGERSHTPGHWDKLQQRLAVMRSSLENFTPAVRPGNQTELGTRAHPFAAYIATMHRQIHKLWAYGFLADLEARTGRTQFDDMSLWTQLEIVLKGDGKLDKVTIVRPSGSAAFDAAALDTVAASSPFPVPPQAIKSANGKIYLDWQFHRDERACATYGVDAHILTTVGDNKEHDTSEALMEGPESVPAPRVLHRNKPAGATQATMVPLIPTPQRSAAAESAPAPAAAPAAPVGVAVPGGVRDAAEGWFAAYVRGDGGWLAGWSAVPFSANGTVVASDPVSVKRMYGELLREAAKDRRLEDFEVLTPAQVRAKLGGLPPGGESDGMFYAIGRIAGDSFVLLLKQSGQGWRVCGLNR